MKKNLFLTLAALLLVSTINAQFFVGGTINFSTSGGSNKINGTTTDKVRYTSFTFSPKGGYIVSEDFYVGAQLIFEMDKATTPATNIDPEEVETTSSFGLVPFARYYAFRADKFSVFAQAQLGLVFGSTKYEAGGTSIKDPKTTSLSFSIFPGIAYDISEKVQLEAYVNGFNFGFNSITKKYNSGAVDKSSSFGLGVTTSGLVTTGNITIGAIIKL